MVFPLRSLVAFTLIVFFLSLLIGCSEKSELVVPAAPAHSIHVAVGGYDSSPGTAEFPVYSLRKAIELALSSGAGQINIAQGQYLGISRFIGGIDLVGGLDPLTWEKIPGGYSILSTQDDSVLGQDIQKPTLISALEFSLRSSQVPMLLFGCGPDLHFVDCKFVALDSPAGQVGGSGNIGSILDSYRPFLNGGPGHCLDDIEAPGGRYLYSSVSIGGDGGSPGESGSNGGDAYSQHPDYPESGLGGAGGLPVQPGQDGAPGADGSGGENGALAAGRVYLRGTALRTISPLRGDYGHDGYMGGGGGGGGGGSTNGTGNGGGAGGQGGHSGNGGNGGENAYPSLAVICNNSLVRFSSCTFQTGNGGAGGDGGSGGLGGPGLPGGLGGTECNAEVGAGGNGGQGGRGGDGGGGAGGHGGDSIGLWILGTFVPVVDDDCIFEIGQPGLGGLGGFHGDDNSRAPSGWDGRREEILVESESQ